MYLDFVVKRMAAVATAAVDNIMQTHVAKWQRLVTVHDRIIWFL